MILPTLLQRDSYGIDTFERAIVFSALLLRYGYSFSEDRAIKDAVQLSLTMAGVGERFTETINLRVGLQVANEALNSGGNILNNIVERFGGSVDWTAGVAEPSTTGLPITTEPSGLTLEQYFYWSCQQLLATNVENYKRIAITPTFKGTADNISLDATVAIAFDYATYLLTNNLITAIGTADESIIPNFGNDYQLTNDLQLTN